MSSLMTTSNLIEKGLGSTKIYNQNFYSLQVFCEKKTVIESASMKQYKLVLQKLYNCQKHEDTFT